MEGHESIVETVGKKFLFFFAFTVGKLIQNPSLNNQALHNEYTVGKPLDIVKTMAKLKGACKKIYGYSLL